MTPQLPEVNQSPVNVQVTVSPVKQVSFMDTLLETLSNLIKTINPIR